MAKKQPAQNTEIQQDIDPSALPSGWNVAEFVDTVMPGRVQVRKIPRSEYLPSGRYPIVDQGQDFIAGFCNDSSGMLQDGLPVIVFGDHTRVFKFIDFPFLAGADGTQILRPQSGFDPRFLFYAYTFLTIPSRGYNRHYTILKQKQVPAPPLNEQKAIACVLQTVQDANDRTNRVIDATKHVRSSLLKHLFSLGSYPAEEANQFELVSSESGEWRSDWAALPLRTVFDLTSGKTRPSTICQSPNGACCHPVFGGNGIMGFADEYLVEQPTIVLGRVGEYCGAVHVAPEKSWISDNALYAKALHVDVELPFLAGALEKLNLNRFKKKSGQPLITQAIVFEHSIPFPKPAEREAIIRSMAAVEMKLSCERRRMTVLQLLFNSLLKSLMRGEIRISNPEVVSSTKPKRKRSQLSEIFGKWPGDESDEVIRKTLEESD